MITLHYLLGSLQKEAIYTTAMLQEFLFYNRKCENILELMDEFQTLIDKNDPKNLERDSEHKKNH